MQKKERKKDSCSTYCYCNPLFLKLVRRENLFAHLNSWTRITSVFRLSHGRETTTCSIHTYIRFHTIFIPNFSNLGPSFSDNTSYELVGNRHFMRLLRGLRPVLVSCKCGQSCNNDQITYKSIEEHYLQNKSIFKKLQHFCCVFTNPNDILSFGWG